MGTETQNLKLFKTDMATDGDELFDFDRDLNENWEKIDAALGGADLTLTTNWEGTEAPFTQEVTVQGMTETRNPSIDVVKSEDLEITNLRKQEFSKIYAGFTSENKITFYATEPTSIELPLN